MEHRRNKKKKKTDKKGEMTQEDCAMRGELFYFDFKFNPNGRIRLAQVLHTKDEECDEFFFVCCMLLCFLACLVFLLPEYICKNVRTKEEEAIFFTYIYNLFDSTSTEPRTR